MGQALLGKNLEIFLVLLFSGYLSICSLDFRGNILRELKEAIHYGYFSFG